MRLQQVLIFLALAVILGVPFALRPAPAKPAAGAEQTPLKLIIVTPHVQQIRDEFGPAFSRWHARKFGAPVDVDWRIPGGTSDILKQLESQYVSAIKTGVIKPDGSCPPGTIGYDLMMGGGSFDHGRLKTGVTARLDAAGPDGKPVEVKLSMSVPAGFTQEELDGWFGENTIGAGNLYDPEQYWIGTALSSFGIVYNRDLYADLQLPEPRTFEDLCTPRLTGFIALADPRQSGSITTTFESILNNYGWDRGWRILREMCANTRYFTNSSTKPPIDVSQGEAAAGLAIDFYGRGQAQSVMHAGEDASKARVGYSDPEGTVYIDADPASILRGGPHPELSKRFIEFCLTEEAQALWQFPPRNDPRSASNPKGEDGSQMGPVLYALRRMPVRRETYKLYWSHLIDQVDPFKLASTVKPAGWRSAIGIMMGCFAIDTAHEQRQAWNALNAARRDPGFPRQTLTEMESLFYSWPVTVVDGKELEFTKDTYKAVRESWKKPGFQQECEIAYTKHFLRVYARVTELGRAAKPIEPSSAPAPAH